jgi:hypothetical protein
MPARRTRTKISSGPGLGSGKSRRREIAVPSQYTPRIPASLVGETQFNKCPWQHLAQISNLSFGIGRAFL